MPQYTVKDTTTGREITFEWSGTQPPTDADMEEVFAAAGGVKTTDEPPTMPPVEGAIDVPPGRKEMRGGLRTVMETGGVLGGGAVGSLLGPIGTIAGETGGYAGMSQAADALLGEDTGGWGKKLLEGAAFSVVPRGLLYGATKLGRGAVRSALKIPPTQVNKETAEGVIDTVIGQNLRVGEKGANKAKAIIRDVESKMDSLLAKSGSEIEATKFAQAIDDIKQKFRYSADPQSAYDVLDAVKQQALSHPEVINGKIPIAEAQKLKKGLYQELKGYYSNFQSLAPKQAITANTESVGKAAWAESARKAIMSDPTIPPEATEWLKKEGNVINALRWIERRANVAANMDPITFNDVLLGGLIREGVPGAVAVRFLRTPAVQSQVGIWLAKGGKYPLRVPIQAGMIGTKNLFQ